MIDYRNVSKAIDYYERCGFRYVEVPWVVSDDAINVTLPAGAVATRCQFGPLVGSAEQSFIHMMQRDELRPGRYCAASPCFRDEPVLTELTRRTFFKVELIDFGDPDPVATTHDLMQTALSFYRGLPGGFTAEPLPTREGVDICLGGIELGSYGYREWGPFRWVYGTGYADPRFTSASG